MALKVYHQKRDFKSTAEPQGRIRKSSRKLRFVVQRHAASHLHYDFRLEMDGVLKSWAVPKGPSLNPEDKRLAMMVEDHPFEYRTFEGSIPKGNYGAGEVEIWDEGTYAPVHKVKTKSDDAVMQAELNSESLKFVLSGKKLKGEFALVKIKNSKDDNAWLLIKHKDKYATDETYDAEAYTSKNSKVTKHWEEKTTSSRGFRNSFAISLAGEKKIEKFVHPMLCKTAAEAFDSDEWAFEIKWDGYRAIADLREDEIQLYSRNGLDFSKKFKRIAHALENQKHPMILDGEIVAYDDRGKPNFQWLQKVDQTPNLALMFQVFDLLWLNGHSTKSLSYQQRKELLRAALIEDKYIQYHDHVVGKGNAFYKLAEDMELEGIVAKKLDSVYSEKTRSAEWLKIKLNQTDEAIICGYTAPKGSRSYFGSLILGKYLNGELVFCGHAGTGFTEAGLKSLFKKMQKLIVEQPPFNKKPKTNGKATWLKPAFVAEIKFTELTKDYMYRHPVFLSLRTDKEVQEINFDEEYNLNESAMAKKISPERKDGPQKIGKRNVTLSNQNKIYFPDDGITKGDVLAYYQSVSKYILPYLKDRPQSLNRFPNGIEGMSFYQKDANDQIADWIPTHKVYSESTGKDVNYIICNNAETMAYLNNLGCIELNVWTSKRKTAEQPDYLVLDLDPSEKNSFGDVIETALEVKSLLDRAGIKGYPKTSGSTGIHVYIPMGAQYDFEQVRDFGHLLMQLVNQELPEITTLERSLSKRDKGKIYLDYLQNRRGQTLASVYSLRPKRGATVSMPLEWEEVKPGLRISDFNIHNALERLEEKGDLFKPVLGKGINMIKAIEKLQQAKNKS